jgi:hypothetical protein
LWNAEDINRGRSASLEIGAALTLIVTTNAPITTLQSIARGRERACKGDA